MNGAELKTLGSSPMDDLFTRVESLRESVAELTEQLRSHADRMHGAYPPDDTEKSIPDLPPECKRPASDTPKAELRAAHRAKMERKAARQYNRADTRVRANLSRRHPDYGLSPVEHFARKTAL